MLRTVGDDIDDISDLVLLKVRAERDHTLLLEIPREAAMALVLVACTVQVWEAYA